MDSGKEAQAGYSATQPPMYATDILAPPLFLGVPGQLIPWSATGVTNNPKFAIFGTDSQVLQVVLQPGEFITSEPGSMVYRGEAIQMATGVGGFGAGFKRALGGESFFRNTYSNTSQYPACIALSSNFPSKIIPVDLSRSGPLSVSPGLYLAHLGDVQITFKFVRNMMAGCFGGSGFLLLKIKGTGVVFLSAGGAVMEKVLAPGEPLLVDSSSMVGFSDTVTYEVRRTGGCMICCCGGEGLFNTCLTGPGLVIVQTMSRNRLRQAIGGHHTGGGGAESRGDTSAQLNG